MTALLGEVDGERAIVWGQEEVERDRDQDQGDAWAWRFITPCDEDCHHPVHAFDVPRGARHLEWFTPGSAALVPISRGDRS